MDELDREPLECKVEDAVAYKQVKGAKKRRILLLVVSAVMVVVVAAVPIAVVTSVCKSPIKLEVNTTLLAVSGEWVTVSWDNVTNPSESDWIGVYTAPIDTKNHAPIKFLPHMTKENGSHKFRLINMRQGIIFAFFRKGLDNSGTFLKGPGSASLAPKRRAAAQGSPTTAATYWHSQHPTQCPIEQEWRKENCLLVQPTCMSEPEWPSTMELICTGEFATFNNPIPVAVSEVVHFQNQNEPLQGHLSLTRDPTEMILTWVSFNVTEPTVKWGMRSGSYTFKKEANTTTYTASDMCGSAANDFGYIDPGIIHHAKMDNLIPGTKYYYIFGDPSYGWSAEYSFTAAPEPGPNASTRVIAFADMGNAHHDGASQVIRCQQDALSTVQRIRNELDETGLVLHLGDISYARGYASVWEFFFDQIQPIATRVPYMVSIGNHERNWPNSGSFYDGVRGSGGECGIPHEVRFPMPRPSLDEAWWGLDYGSIHFIVMSTEHDFTPTSRQYQFLENELRSINHSRTPWTIVGGHRPMYANSIDIRIPAGVVVVSELLQQSLEELFKNYSVDVALWGHEHSYQRTCPVYRKTCTTPEEGIVHVVVGTAGERLGIFYPLRLPSWLETFDHMHYGFLRIAANATSLVLEFVWNEDGEVHDRLVMTKS